jgi:transposase
MANHPNVTAIDVAEALGIHVVMLYRWRLEWKRGMLRENKNMKKTTRPPPKKTKSRKQSDALRKKEEELIKARRQIKSLERSLAASQEELDILKKAKRFFEKQKR